MLDCVAVERMFNFLFDVCEELAPNFQIIISEHANLSSNERFQVEGADFSAVS